MRSPVFEIKEHTLECQHIREYARSTSHTQEDVLHLAIKQYIPRNNREPHDGDVTIIGAHANGFPKELYEPLWEDLIEQSKVKGFRIRSIWIADVAQQGASGVLNEALLGDDPSWTDHARDLLHMTNHFRSEMPMPIVGIGHSFGGNILCNLAFMHPRLLSTVVLLDPVIASSASAPQGPSLPRLSAYRRDRWPSKTDAEAGFRKAKFYKAWDPRVLDRWCKYGLRETPTALYPNETGSATLSTTKHQECLTFLRGSWDAVTQDGKITKPELVPDMSPDHLNKFPFYRPEPPNTFARLGELRPSVLYIFGEESPLSSPEARKAKMDRTGIEVGGSGGAKLGRVQEIVLPNVGHLVAMDACEQCANAAATWLESELQLFEKQRKQYEEWTRLDQITKSTLSDEWKKRVGGPLERSKV